MFLKKYLNTIFNNYYNKVCTVLNGFKNSLKVALLLFLIGSCFMLQNRN